LFNNNVEDGADFCEAYKSQILNDDSVEKESSLATVLKILTILLLLAIIVAVSIYGYTYFMKSENSNTQLGSPPVSIQTLESDELGDLRVELASPDNAIPMVKEEVAKIKVVEVTTSKPVKELDIDKIANDVKLAIAKNEQEESDKLKLAEDKKSLEKNKVLEVPVEDSQSAYLEELAKLSKEIDKERE
jgi:hypothetical protein